jgi:hypothetical protein
MLILSIPSIGKQRGKRPEFFTSPPPPHHHYTTTTTNNNNKNKNIITLYDTLITFQPTAHDRFYSSVVQSLLPFCLLEFYGPLLKLLLLAVLLISRKN